MTPSQIDRAVRAALLDVLPPIVARLRDELAAAMAQHLVPAEALPPAPVPEGDRTARGTPGVPISAEQVDRIHALAGAGLGNPAIAAEVGCSLPTVRARLKKIGGVAAPNPSPRSRRLTGDDVALIWRQHDAGRTIGQIAEDLGASWATVQHRLSQPRPGALASPVRPAPPPPVVAALPPPAIPVEAAPEVAVPEAVAATMDEIEEWLTEEMRRQGRDDAAFEARMLTMDSRVLFNTANAQRRLLGLPSFVVQGRAA